MKIAPAILESDYEGLKQQIYRIKNLFGYAQIDIMDGKFVDQKSFDYKQDNNLNLFFRDINTKLELHLMVKDPIEEVKKWESINNVFRVVFHIESKRDPNEIIPLIKKQNRQVGIALNPKTETNRVISFLDEIDVLQFMTVTPGRQGNDFIPEVKEKIKEITKNTRRPIISVDGGINQNNIKEVESWGTDIANIGSGLLKAQDLEKKLELLYSYIENK